MGHGPEIHEPHAPVPQARVDAHAEVTVGIDAVRGPDEPFVQYEPLVPRVGGQRLDDLGELIEAAVT
jgi:hypothetical protein